MVLESGIILPLILSIIDITGTKEMSSVSVSHGKVFFFPCSGLAMEIWCIPLDKVCS
jgi:hypothetical protein